jgi:titin
VIAGSDGGSADVSWSAPATDGGAAITGYTATAYASSVSATPVASCTTAGATACSITGLTNRTAYYVAVTAANAAGIGAASAPRTIVTPLARPSAPTLSGVTVGDGSLSAAFSAGAIGDGTLVRYEYSVDGGATWAAASGTSSPISIVGLTNGTTYHVVLRAVSTAGPGAASTPVDGTPYGYPSAPDPATIVANGGNGQITVSWAAADLNGGLLGDYTATAFTAQSSGSTAGTCTTSGLSCVIPGLGNGTTYWISLQTRNSVSMYSQRSAPRVPAIPSTRPGAPTGVSAVAADGSATVGWTAPTSTGASAISGYTVLCSTGGSYTSCGSVTGSATSLRVTGLTNGTAYTFEVTATNGSGAGPASAASASVTPLAAGVAPTFGAPSATADGFTVAIANYDAAATYTVSASAGTATRSGATITVSGLDAATASTVTVAAARTGFTTASSTVEGSSLKAGIAPTFSGRTATPTGFTFVIANYDAASDYALTATDGAEVSRDGATVTVSGLALGGASQVTVEVSKAGSTDASGTVSGTAMALGTAPVLAGLVSTDTGFRFEISNYDASLVYSLAAAGGATAARSGSTVTVTGLTDGAASDVTVTVTDPGVSVASAVEHGAALLAGAAPAVSGIVSTVDGFTFHLDLSDAAVAYSALSAPGVVSMAPDGTVTVTGLAPGESADVTISAIQTGHVTATTTVTGSALLTGIAPLFAAPERTSDGFTVAIDNLDADGTYAVSSSSGTATVAAGVIAVTGLAPDAAATVTVTVSHVGYTDGVSTTSGAALAAGAEPTFTDVVPTADGFTFTIADYDASLTYTTQLSPTGVVVIDGSGHGVVSGLAPGTSATLAVTATDPGVSTATATTGATVLLPTAAVQLSAATPLAGGYSFRIVDYDPAVTYSFTQADGGTVVRSGDTVTVSGLGAAVTSATTVSATSAGHTVEVATASGTSFPDGAAPGIGAVTRTLDGFSFTFTADPSASYTAASDAGTVTITGTTVTVTGLAPGATTTVHLTASVPGSLDATSDVAGTAIALGVAPVLGAPVSTAHGFVVVIANYSALTAYRLSTSAGTITRDAGRVTVAGLAVGASATVTVTAVRSGYRDASATQAGSATAPVVRTAPASATVPTPSAPTTTTGTTATESSDISGPGVPKALQGVDESAPGTGTVQSDGAALPSKLSSEGDRVVLTTRHGFRLTVSGWEHGTVTPIGPHGVIEVLRGGTTRVVVSGLAPDSEIAMWGMSHLQQLVTTRTDHDGALTQLVRLPYSMAPGAHTLIVTGVDTDGGQVTMQVGIRVLPVAHEAPVAPAGGSWWWLLLVALVALLALFAWFVIARRRRQRREA